jgi:MOSC domain-containing protein YiiM
MASRVPEENVALIDSPNSTMRGRLLSLQAGPVMDLLTPQAALPDDRPAGWRSGIFKAPISGPVNVTSAGVEGDQQADLKNHGGPDNVILAYDAGHYPVWRDRLTLPDLAPGSFGENFTVAGFSDDTVCIGDVWHVGPELILQVTQPRQPCFKLARRLGRPDIVKMIVENSWGGWYLRVLHEGTAEAGMAIRLGERRHPEWPVARAVQTMYARKADPAPALALASVPELSARWKRELVEQAQVC